jgi:hypothetical protein
MWTPSPTTPLPVAINVPPSIWVLAGIVGVDVVAAGVIVSQKRRRAPAASHLAEANKLDHPTPTAGTLFVRSQRRNADPVDFIAYGRARGSGHRRSRSPTETAVSDRRRYRLRRGAGAPHLRDANRDGHLGFPADPSRLPGAARSQYRDSRGQPIHTAVSSGGRNRFAAGSCPLPQHHVSSIRRARRASAPEDGEGRGPVSADFASRSRRRIRDPGKRLALSRSAPLSNSLLVDESSPLRDVDRSNAPVDHLVDARHEAQWRVLATKHLHPPGDGDRNRQSWQGA